MNSVRKLLLLGGGGHCRSVIDSILSITPNPFDEIGIIDYSDCHYCGIHVVGKDEDLRDLYKRGWTDALITVGSIGNTSIRRKLYRLIKDIGYKVPTIIDPTAIIASYSSIEDGAFIGKGAIVNTNTTLGSCCIINTGAVIEHDCQIGAFSHISPGAVLCGEVIIGSDCHIGVGSVIKQQVVIGNNALIGAGSVVLKDLPERIVAYGNPCRVIE